MTASPDVLPFDPAEVPSPCYVIDLDRLRGNLETLADVQARAGCRVLLALKGFAAWSTFPLVRQYLSGAAASGLHEARLAREQLGGELHVYSPAYGDHDVDAVLALADHVVFNTFGQWERFKPRVLASGRAVSCGIRLNPEHSEAAVALYDPCGPASRLGERAARFTPERMAGLEGIHFHNLCECGADALARTLAAVERSMAPWLPGVRWVNFGGGHAVTAPGYDVERLVALVRDFAARWGVQVYLEPGAAVAYEAGWLVSTVLDVVDGAPPTAVLDTSATAHMPDVLEMPYRPRVLGAGAPGERPFTVRLGGLSCLAGDVVGDYSFDRPLCPGDRIALGDMAQYSMVKNTTFNGVPLPSIATWDRENGVRVVRTFGYEDYRDRLS